MARVLVVDDDQDCANSLGVVLTWAGHEVQVVYDPHHALRVARERRPDIALLDIGLPGVDGFELARRLHASLDGKAIRLMALTGYNSHPFRSRAAELGFEKYFVKPADPAQIEDALVLRH